MKRLFLLVAITTFLVGCATPNEIRSKGPDSQYHSLKDISEVSECILLGWQTKSYVAEPMKAFIQPLKNGKTVYTDDYIEIADLTTTENGVDIKFYSQGRYHKGEMIDVIKSCI